MIHETGHWLDHEALPGAGFSSESSPVLVEWRKAVKASQAYQNLQNKPGYASSKKYRRYMMDFRELWARSYAQYIATKSADKTLLNQIARILDGKVANYWVDSHWTAQDFAPIMTAIDNLFTTQGWL